MRIIIGTLIFVVAAFVACNKKDSTTTTTDPCNIVCENGGYCQDGSCFCPRGYEGKNCEKRWLSRYIGNWNMIETIRGSSDANKRGMEKEFVVKIKDEEDNALRFFIDNFSGNDTYNDVSCEAGVKPNGGYDIATAFSFTKQQTIKNTYITILKGSGTVNELGTTILAEYTTYYLNNGEPYIDTVYLRGTIIL